jgi:hypothetical protein
MKSRQVLTEKVSTYLSMGPTFIDFFFDGVLEEEQNSGFLRPSKRTDQPTKKLCVIMFKDFVNAEIRGDKTLRRRLLHLQ